MALTEMLDTAYRQTETLDAYLQRAADVRAKANKAKSSYKAVNGLFSRVLWLRVLGTEAGFLTGFCLACDILAAWSLRTHAIAVGVTVLILTALLMVFWLTKAGKAIQEALAEASSALQEEYEREYAVILGCEEGLREAHEELGKRASSLGLFLLMQASLTEAFLSYEECRNYFDDRLRILEASDKKEDQDLLAQIRESEQEAERRQERLREEKAEANRFFGQE